MKFFIVTFSLLAIAFANHMEQQSSSEESVNISQEKFKQEKNVVILPSEENICSTLCQETTKNAPEMESSSISSSEESAEVPTEKKNSQFEQKLNFFQCLQALSQNQIAMNPWDQIKICAHPIIPTLQYKQKKDMVEHTRQETPKKTIDMESTDVFTEKTEMTEEEKNLIKYLNIVKQVTWPQYLQVDHQYKKTMNPWNHVVINPYEVIFAQRYL
ncbi:alpha-S2-casein-like [Castor canadensis]|uniref:Alpha-S2-casein-like n=1 Tax=Castor canadensis TaxID=51338 RepID=A0AC58JZR5_CASCN